MAEQVNIGVIGTSWWAELMFLPMLQNYERAHLVAICGRNQERANEVASKYAIPEVYADYRHMIQNSNLDAIIVSTPDDTHYDMVMAAFDARLHVLCEKPVALNAAHALEMFNKAEETGLKHMVMYTHYWLPYVQHTKQLLEDDFLGTVHHGTFHWVATYGRDGSYNWRFDADRSNGVVSDLGSHVIHMARWLLGDVVSITGQLGFYVAREGLDGKAASPAHDTVQFILEFANGAQIQFNISAAAHVPDASMKLSLNFHGEKGVLDAGWVAHPLDTIWINAQQSDSNEKFLEKKSMNLRDFFNNNPIGVRLFIDSILDDKPIYPGLKEGYEVQRIIDAVIQSHETGRRVMI